MRGIGFRALVLVLSCSMFPAALAWAAVPDPTKCTLGGTYILIGGKQTVNPALPDQSNNIGYSVTVRDFANNPVPDAVVEFNFQNCTDLRLCNVSDVAGQIVECGNATWRATTNALGQVTIKALGGGTNAGQVAPPNVFPGPGLGCVRIYAEGVQLGFATALHLNPDGARGGASNPVTGLDLSIMLTEVGAGNSNAPFRGRSDYDRNGVPPINGSDFAAFLTTFQNDFAGFGSGAGCATAAGAAPYCP